jgi:hypothetical protein
LDSCAIPPLSHPPLSQLVLSEITSASPPSLQAVKALAAYMKGPSQREAVMEEVAAWLHIPAAANDPVVLLVAAMLYALEDNYVESLKTCHSSTELEL